MGIGWTEILLSLVLVIIFMGPRHIPELLRSLFKIKHEFRKFQLELMKEKEELLSIDNSPPTTPRYRRHRKKSFSAEEKELEVASINGEEA